MDHRFSSLSIVCLIPNCAPDRDRTNKPVSESPDPLQGDRLHTKRATGAPVRMRSEANFNINSTKIRMTDHDDMYWRHVGQIIFIQKQKIKNKKKNRKILCMTLLFLRILTGAPVAVFSRESIPLHFAMDLNLRIQVPVRSRKHYFASNKQQKTISYPTWR